MDEKQKIELQTIGRGAYDGIAEMMEQTTRTGYRYLVYQYFHSDGREFEICGPSMEWCVAKKKQWLLATEQGITV